MIDGVNHLNVWMGKTPISQRTHIFNYDEIKLTDMRMRLREFLFSTKEEYGLCPFGDNHHD